MSKANTPPTEAASPTAAQPRTPADYRGELKAVHIDSGQITLIELRANSKVVGLGEATGPVIIRPWQELDLLKVRVAIHKWEKALVERGDNVRCVDMPWWALEPGMLFAQTPSPQPDEAIYYLLHMKLDQERVTPDEQLERNRVRENWYAGTAIFLEF